MDYLAVAAGALAAGFISGLTGFGTGLTALGIWLHFLTPQVAVPLVTGCSVVAQVVSLISIRPSLNLRRLGMFIPAGLIGVPLGAYLLIFVRPEPFKVAAGIFLVMICMAFLVAGRRIRFRVEKRAADAGVGFAGGVLGGFSGLSGVLPVLWAVLQGWPKDEQRALNQPYNLVILLFAFAAQGIAGLFTSEFLTVFALCIPATVIGNIAGVAAYRRTDDAIFRKIVLTVLTLSGVVLILSNIGKA